VNAPGFVDAFLAHVRTAPDRTALTAASRTEPSEVERFSFSQVHRLAVSYAAGLGRAGLRRGDRLVLAFDPGVDFYALALAVIGTGGVAVLVDPVTDRRRLVSVLRSAGARGIVGDPGTMRRWWRSGPMVRTRRYAPGHGCLGVAPLDHLLEPGEHVALEPSPSDVPAIITYKAGPGRAKGVVVTHGTLMARHIALARHLPVRAGGVDLSCSAAMVLHNLCLGATSVLAPIDPRQPEALDPGDVVDMARRARVTSLSATPHAIGVVADHLGLTGERLPAVRHVVVDGAPVSRALCERVLEAFPDAEARVVYGRAGAGPIAHVTMHEVLAADDDGLVGAPVPGVDIVIADLPDRMERVCDRLELIDRRVRVGEILVRGAVVSHGYVGDRAAEGARRVREPGGMVWHRTGDVGVRDRHGRLWLLGRRGDGVLRAPETLHPPALGVASASRREPVARAR
jgi:olefin beta-lactone synthetase